MSSVNLMMYCYSLATPETYAIFIAANLFIFTDTLYKVWVKYIITLLSFGMSTTVMSFSMLHYQHLHYEMKINYGNIICKLSM